jgi:FkbH-like protein
MTRNLYSDLAWLPEPPADARAQIRALSPDSPGAGEAIMRLAAHALTDADLTRLGETIGRLSVTGRSLAPLNPFKLGIVGTGTLDLLVPMLVGTAARHGVQLECVCAGYGQVAQEALEPKSKINSAKCDAVLIALDYRSLPIPPALGGRGSSLDACAGFVDTLRNGFRANGGAISILQSFAPPAEPLFGSLDRSVAHTTRSLLESLNRRLVDSLQSSPDMILDVAAVAETVGLAEWYSPAQWNLAKLPFSATYARLYADHLGRLLGAIRGNARRCLILDLDNTVWGGVIGDDGLTGIRLAQGDATGEAYLEVQRAALDLRARGVVLAVASKNTDAVARAAFREHPEMLLREDHIASFQMNWNDKATNIRAIAEHLGLGLSSMVLLDDNPVERGLVRRLLPAVAVPELPDDPAYYARTLSAAGYFEAVAFSDEDRNRAAFYQDNAKRTSLQTETAGVEAYLRSLKSEIVFAPFDLVGRERISQLINKSNQYNLTTRRYTEAEVAAAESDPNTFTLQARLTDIFGDNGMISVIVARQSEAEEWEIDTWLMSCRVLGRKVEEMMLRELVMGARVRGVKRLIGVYRPSERNEMVRDHYAKLNFRALGDGPDNSTRWVLDTWDDLPPGSMSVVRAGFELNEALG